MIQSYNIGTKDSIKKDLKKKKTELLTKYHPIGFIEDNFFKGEEKAAEKKFAMGEKVRAISQQSGRSRIDSIRKMSGSLIGASTRFEKDHVDNTFVHSSMGLPTSPFTLSMYTREEDYRRPTTAPTNKKPDWLKKYAKLQPVPEEGAGEVEVKDTRLPDFKVPPKLTHPTRLV